MNETDRLPVFPANAPLVFSDPAATNDLFGPVLSQLSSVVDIDNNQLGNKTPCSEMAVDELQRHVLGWLQFFAAALNDPAGASKRPDPETWRLDQNDSPSTIVKTAATDLARATNSGVSQQLVVMSQARMKGDAVLAMALGEYLVHGWDLAVATSRPWNPDDEAAGPALEFLQGIVAPEHRGPDSGFFDQEVPAPPGAAPFERLLAFTGRNPAWTPPAS